MTFWDSIGSFFYSLSVDFISIPRLLCFCAMIIGYFFGLFQTGYFISRMKHVDIYSQGSGNPGATNMTRVMGPVWGLVTFIFDVGKVVLAILVCRYVFLTWLGLPIDPIALTLYTGLGAVLGHDFPIYLQGRGGKGVASVCAVIVMIGEWKYIIVGAFVFFLVFLLTRYVSLASMMMVVVTMFEFLFFTLINWTYVDPDWLVDCHVIMIILAVLTIVTHRKNIVRLLMEEEPRFRFRKKKREEELEQAYGDYYTGEEDDLKTKEDAEAFNETIDTATSEITEYTEEITAEKASEEVTEEDSSEKEPEETEPAEEKDEEETEEESSEKEAEEAAEADSPETEEKEETETSEEDSAEKAEETEPETEEPEETEAAEVTEEETEEETSEEETEEEAEEEIKEETEETTDETAAEEK